MDYPVWGLASLGGGFFIALIATLHVYVAHFAVGGGLFLVLAEAKARRENSRPMLDYVRSHTKFFLLLTMVFGGVSGVALWFCIAVLSPGATVTLVRNFVWGWATEWTFFLGEIVALLIYHSSFDRLPPRDHLRVGWIYFLFAWLSLFVVNGIIGVMLTPGQWRVTGDFWQGLFNPSFWPSLVFRSFLAFLLAGLFGLLTVSRIDDAPARDRMARTCAAWAILSLPPMLLSGYWYLKILPAPTRDFVLFRSSEMPAFFSVLAVTAALIMALALLNAARLPRLARRPVALALIVIGLGYLGAFEFIREAARKPWLIPGHTWSTGITPLQAEPLSAPYLARSRWTEHKTVTADNLLPAGRDLFTQQCLACHAVGGPMKDIRRYTAGIGPVGLTAYLTGQGRLFGYMPPFIGSDAEKAALAAYIATEINTGAAAAPKPPVVSPKAVDIPPFDAEAASHVLLAWNTLGMVAISDCDGSFSLRPPGNTQKALLIRRDIGPTVETKDARIEYAAPKGFATPSKETAYWTFSPSLAGRALQADASAAGTRPDGIMTTDPDGGLATAPDIPLTPYVSGGGLDPYPVLAVTAKDAATGAVLARTASLAPVSTEMGCWRCHGGTWRVDGATGISPATAGGVLAVHDKRNATNLAARAANGQPVACQSCHPDEAVGATGNPALLNFSAAIHGFHANYIDSREEDACARCHPSSQDGLTRSARDNHAAMGLTCVNCHGAMADHALSLLAAEASAGKKQAARLMDHLTPGPDVGSIAPRKPWIQEPDCLTCHRDFGDATEMTAFNAWTKDAAGLFRNRREDTGNIPCAACHGSPHGTYPADNAWGEAVNNIQPLQYMGKAAPIGSGKRCAVCHTMEMEGDVHHPNMIK